MEGYRKRVEKSCTTQQTLLKTEVAWDEGVENSFKSLDLSVTRKEASG